MVTTNLPFHVVQEISLEVEVRRNQTGDKVKRVQEWLTFHGFGTAIDEDFGPATERCVKNFQCSPSHVISVLAQFSLDTV